MQEQEQLNVEPTTAGEQTEAKEASKPKSKAEQLRDKTESLGHAQTYILGLENMIDDLLPGWREQPDNELPAYIQAFHQKYKRIEERIESAGKTAREAKDALVDRTRAWDTEKARITQRHGETMAKSDKEVARLQSDIRQWREAHGSLSEKVHDLEKAKGE